VQCGYILQQTVRTSFVITAVLVQMSKQWDTHNVVMSESNVYFSFRERKLRGRN